LREGGRERVRDYQEQYSITSGALLAICRALSPNCNVLDLKISTQYARTKETYYRSKRDLRIFAVLIVMVLISLRLTFSLFLSWYQVCGMGK
jgi:hypothetical protein